MPNLEFDVVIIGAGLSGIGVARYLQQRLPGKRYTILETKAGLGGTWELFRYPGIRSDSDMHTMGYAFKPWKDAKAIADGPAILSYIKETAAENGIDEHIRYRHKVRSASYSSATQRWTLDVEHEGRRLVFTCAFLLSCAGYYRHDEAYLPRWEGYEDYRGTLVHPQFWPQGLDYAGKTVAIIGSGATAVTLTPALAEKAAHVYQVQRSPTYIVNRPAQDRFANTLRRILPEAAAYSLTRWKTILAGVRRRKRMARDIKAAKRMLVGDVAKALGPGYDWRTHFVPSYWPGQQRICAVPDGDMFRALREGRASMVTGDIERFTPTGLRMQDGRHIEADIIVTATGLVLEALGGIAVSVDGQHIDPARLLIYKGFMYSNVPNLIYFTGYTNASWTLKIDLVADYACRLIQHMDRQGHSQVVPLADDAAFSRTGRALNKFIAGYVVRAAHRMPKHGAAFPWVHEQDYLWDRKVLRRGKLEDGTLAFSQGEPIVLPAAQRAEALAA